MYYIVVVCGNLNGEIRSRLSSSLSFSSFLGEETLCGKH